MPSPSLWPTAPASARRCCEGRCRNGPQAITSGKHDDGLPAPVHKPMPPALQITGGAGIEAR
jgi:hypothetical protein